MKKTLILAVILPSLAAFARAGAVVESNMPMMGTNVPVRADYLPKEAVELLQTLLLESPLFEHAPINMDKVAAMTMTRDVQAVLRPLVAAAVAQAGSVSAESPTLPLAMARLHAFSRMPEAYFSPEDRAAMEEAQRTSTPLQGEQKEKFMQFVQRNADLLNQVRKPFGLPEGEGSVVWAVGDSSAKGIPLAPAQTGGGVKTVVQSVRAPSPKSLAQTPSSESRQIGSLFMIPVMLYFALAAPVLTGVILQRYANEAPESEQTPAAATAPAESIAAPAERDAGKPAEKEDPEAGQEPKTNEQSKAKDSGVPQPASGTAGYYSRGVPNSYDSRNYSGGVGGGRFGR